MTPGSLRIRLAAGGALAIAAALVIAGFGLVKLFERNALRTLEADLEADLRQALAALEIGPDGTPAIATPLTDPRFDEPMSGLYWQIATPEGVARRSRSLWDETLQLPTDTPKPGEVHRHMLATQKGADMLAVERVVIMKRASADVPVRVVMAADSSRIAAARRAFTGELIPSLLLLGSVLALATWVQIGLGLKPLERLHDAIAAIRQGKAQRVPGPAPSEVAPLVDEINALLDHQARELQRSRARAQDLAHGLRTPLTALDADVRTLEDQGQGTLAARIREVSEAMRRHVEREMARANIRGSKARAITPPVEIAPLVQTLVTIQKRTPRSAALAFHVSVPAGAVTTMDKGDLAEVLGNLLENAARHARTRVGVQLSADGHLHVDDDGPGIPPDKIDQVRQRGARLDSKGGAGLGLAIVSEVLEANGRELGLSVSPQGGLRASVPV